MSKSNAHPLTILGIPENRIPKIYPQPDTNTVLRNLETEPYIPTIPDTVSPGLFNVPSSQTATDVFMSDMLRAKSPNRLSEDLEHYLLGKPIVGQILKASSNLSRVEAILENQYGANSGLAQWWKSLDYDTQKALLESYGEDLSLSASSLIKDLAELQHISVFPDIEAPVYGDFVQDTDDITAEINSILDPAYTDAFARLDDDLTALNSEIDTQRTAFEDQLRESSNMYNQHMSNILSNQYMANAQTYDALQSDLRKSRQSALEAGASAGVRIAGNVNALLSAQNKQSQASLDTSNALAEMLLQQRNAAAGIRSDYRNYMSSANDRKSNLNARRTDLETSRRSEFNTRFNETLGRQEADYNRAYQTYNDQLSSWERQFNKVPATNKLKSPYESWLTYNT